MTNPINLLFVDDEKNSRDSFLRLMRNQKDLTVETASNGREALKKLRSFPADILVTDVFMPVMDGMALLEGVKKHHPDIFVLIVTGLGSVEDAVRAIKAGAFDYILKPFNIDAIKQIIANIAQHKKILQQNNLPVNGSETEQCSQKIVSHHPEMLKLCRKIAQVAKTNATVLITGESGTGKELIAEALHFMSSRRNKPLIRVNCATFTETLINSELFGHEKGAFTGAFGPKKGLFETADGGSLFLDEIGDVPMQTQIALLRVLQSGTFQRVGGNRTLKVDARIICATNKNLTHEIQKGNFREDLFYRINVVTVSVPPLRERQSDIPPLAVHFLKKSCTETKKHITGISRSAMNVLLRHEWPGNVRELSNIIERAIIFCNGKEIIPDDLPEELKKKTYSQACTLHLSSMSLPLAESILIRKALDETGWNIKRAAEKLEIARGTLYNKIKKYGFVKP